MQGRDGRMSRTFVGGEKADIYVAVLKAVSKVLPRTSIPKTEIMRQVNSLLASEQPHTHEVTRVLERMSDAAKNHGTGQPVIEWDKKSQTLHVVDPTFGFFLRWGNWTPV
jgi:hypothetical protein